MFFKHCIMLHDVAQLVADLCLNASFVRFIGGGLAPYVAGRLVLAVNIHVPFVIAAGAIVAGIAILSAAGE